MGTPPPSSPMIPLQWRAGQLPGQTRWHPTPVVAHDAPSMEGRAIARPNMAPPLPQPHRQRSFNGGPGNCPAKRRTRCHSLCRERTFNGGPGNCPAKPDVAGFELREQPPFNGGPGNCPAKPACTALNGDLRCVTLQWRAGQLPGQTWLDTEPFTVLPTSFNGGPGNCPAKHRAL